MSTGAAALTTIIHIQRDMSTSYPRYIVQQTRETENSQRSTARAVALALV
jgi:hypothetical protein